MQYSTHCFIITSLSMDACTQYYHNNYNKVINFIIVYQGGRIPVRWTAPEAISHRSFSIASDVWSFGVLLWEIMTYGEIPYEGWDNYTVFNRLEEGERLKQPRVNNDDSNNI